MGSARVNERGTLAGTSENRFFVGRYSRGSTILATARIAIAHQNMREPLAIILAAGKGKRMGTDLPKVLVPVCGRPMIRYVIDAVRAAGVKRILVVVGYRADLVRRELADQSGIEFVVQTEQLGTGHAVMMCKERLETHDGPVLILAGDSPMVQVTSLRALLAEFTTRFRACLLGTGKKDNPRGLGRIVRDPKGEFSAIVEEKDATEKIREIKEVNLSTYVFRPDALLSSLEHLTANNVQGEYYLTDCPGVLKKEGQRVDALCVLQPSEALSINTKEELAVVEEELKKLATQPKSAASEPKSAAPRPAAKPASSTRLAKPKSQIRKKSK
jgi:bifunctional UDP-N-acetylglucosamine pyrophosphorylase/glucosamine-1-phosphate N-acetyltransferase/UDP-N-acetylglucosamine pyrophosphorylase